MTYVSKALRKLVFDRAGGRCEYCLVVEDRFFSKHQVDHIIAEKHGGPTLDNNLALCCNLCNKYKGSDISSVDDLTGDTVSLYNPRIDLWDEHFILDDGFLVGTSPKGRVTIRLLRLNSQIRLDQRYDVI